jgi:hypothetical protein
LRRSRDDADHAHARHVEYCYVNPLKPVLSVAWPTGCILRFTASYAREFSRKIGRAKSKRLARSLSGRFCKRRNTLRYCALRASHSKDDPSLRGKLMVNNAKLGAALAQTLGNDSVVLIRGHGNAVVGGSLPWVVLRAVYTQLNARCRWKRLRLAAR